MLRNYLSISITNIIILSILLLIDNNSALTRPETAIQMRLRTTGKCLAVPRISTASYGFHISKYLSSQFTVIFFILKHNVLPKNAILKKKNNVFFSKRTIFGNFITL